MIYGNTEFIEEHTALADSEIECEILAECIERGCEWNTDYKVPKVVERVTKRTLTIVDKDKQEHTFEYTHKRKISGKDGYRLTVKE